MRLLLPFVLIALAGCAGAGEYKDTNAAVDANPLCTSQPDRPGEPVAKECERTQSYEIKSSGGDSKPVDFGGKQQN